MLKYEKNHINFFTVGIFLILSFPILYCSFYYKENICDDAFIYFRYLRNFTTDHVLVYNKNEFILGFTSTIYSLFSIAFALLIKNVILSQVLLNSLIILLNALIIFLLIKKFFNKALAFYGIILFSTTYQYYEFIGMESNLQLLFILLGLFFFFDDQFKYIPIIGCLAFFTRGESLILFGLIFIYFVTYKKEMVKIKYFLSPIIVTLSIISFNFYYYTVYLPPTISAKINQGRSLLWQITEFLNYKTLYYAFFDSNIAVFLASCFLISGLFFTKKIIKTKFRIIIWYYLFSYLFYVIFNIPLYFWYLSPFFLGLNISVILGANYLLEKKGILIKIIVVASLVIILGNNIYTLITKKNKISDEYINLKNEYKDVGLWLKNNTEENSKIAAVEIGRIGWYSERYIIDILGLVSPYNAKYVGEKNMKKWINKYNPDYIVFHYPRWENFECIESEEAFSKKYKILDQYFPELEILKKIEI